MNRSKIMYQRIFTAMLRPTRSLHSDFMNTTESDGVRNIVLNHPKSRNCLSLNMMDALLDAINYNKDNVALRTIVISATGSVFSSGHNLAEMHESTGIDQHKEIFDKATQVMMAIRKSPVPVIAKVNGFAVAAGCQLVATCDLAICSDKSRFSTPGANFGIFCSTPGIAIGRAMPQSRAMYMLLTGEPLNAQEAYLSGLVTKVVEESQLDSEVDKIIEKVTYKSRAIVSMGKEFFYKQMSMNVEDAYKHGAAEMVNYIGMKDGKEGIQSFIERRKANWNHSEN